MKTLKTSILFSLVLAISIFALYGCNTNITEKEIRSSDEGYHYITFKQGWTKNG